MFAREVDEDPAMIDALSDALLWNIDCEKGEGIEIAKKYEIRGYPTFIAVNGKGEVTDSWIGYEGAEKWSASVVAAKKDRRTIGEKEAAFKAEPTLELALALGSNASTGAKYKEAVAYWGKAEKINPENATQYRGLILMDMMYGMDSGDFTIDEVAAKAEIVMADEETPLVQKLELAMMMKYMCEKTGQLERSIPFLAAAMTASEGSTDEKVIEYREYIAPEHALLVEKDTPKALELYRARMPEGWEEDPARLNRFAWWCFENDINLEEAQEMAAKGVELAETDQEKANILDTAAEICNALGNCDEALAKIQKAIELDPENEHFQEQLARFEKAVADKKKG